MVDPERAVTEESVTAAEAAHAPARLNWAARADQRNCNAAVWAVTVSGHSRTYYGTTSACERSCLPRVWERERGLVLSWKKTRMGTGHGETRGVKRVYWALPVVVDCHLCRNGMRIQSCCSDVG